MNNSKHFVYKKAKLLRRICSFFLDSVFALLIILLFSITITPLYESSKSYKNNMKNYNDFVISTNLYKYDSDNNLTKNVLIDYSSFYYTFIENGQDVYNNILDSYDESKDGEFYNYIDNLTYNKYLQVAVKNNEIANQASNVLGLYHYASLVSYVFIALLISFLVFPLCNKNGKSVGKIIFHLKVISTKGDLSLTKLQSLFRGLVVIYFEITASILTVLVLFLPITLIISFIVMLVNKKGQAFHDLCCSTIVVDEDVFEDIKENEKIELVVYEK